MHFYFLGHNFLESNVLRLNQAEGMMARSLISTLKRHAGRLRFRLPSGYRPEPMPRLRWYS